MLVANSGESGDAIEGAGEDRGRRQRRLDGKLSTCPEMGSRSSENRQSVEAPGQVCRGVKVSRCSLMCVTLNPILDIDGICRTRPLSLSAAT